MRRDQDLIKENLEKLSRRRPGGEIPDVEARITPAREMETPLRRNARYTDSTTLALWWSARWNVSTWGP